MDITTDFKAFQDRVTASLVQSTRSAGNLANEDLSYHRSSSTRISKALDGQNLRLLQLTNRLLKAATDSSAIKAPKLLTAEHVDDKWREIIDVVDHSLEQADICLDEFTGILKRMSPAQESSPAPSPAPVRERKKFPSIHPNIPKPQDHFVNPPNNHDTSFFKPLIRSKPNAVVSFESSMMGGGSERYPQPYLAEIQDANYPDKVRMRNEPAMYTPVSETEAVWVDTQEGVQDMLADLKQANEIAIDLEHHDQHSYIGIVSLMQISTRNKDWVVDTLKPWREDLQVLNEVFTDPSIVKVLHGSNMDVIWLQRDLGLYIVNLFDTYHACVALSLPGRGLKYLLERFANFQAQKQYQMADWRTRPLPKDLLDYARSDTHYLLYVYDMLCNMLIDASSPGNDLLTYVEDHSRKEARQRYERPIYDKENGLGPLGWYFLLTRRSLNYTKEQIGVFRAVHEWRDRKARDLDEGFGMIMPNTVLFNISEAMPTNMGDLMAAMRPISKHVAENWREVVDAVKAGKDAGREGATLTEIITRNEAALGPRIGAPKISTVKKPQDQQHQGIGAMVQQLTMSGELSNEPQVERSITSQLWGHLSTQVAASLRETFPQAYEMALKMVMPLPSKPEVVTNPVPSTTSTELPERPLTPTTLGNFHPSQKPATNGTTPFVTDFTPTTSLPATPASSIPSTGTFTLKELSRKRKATSDALASNTDNVSLAVDADDNSPGFINNMQNPESKAARKAAKKAARAEAKAARNAANDEGEFTPFDYAAQPDLLHSDQTMSINGKAQGKNGPTPFNPYKKALDTSTGAKKRKIDEGGKQMTFRK